MRTAARARPRSGLVGCAQVGAAGVDRDRPPRRRSSSGLCLFSGCCFGCCWFWLWLTPARSYAQSHMGRARGTQLVTAWGANRWRAVAASVLQVKGAIEDDADADEVVEAAKAR